MAQGRDATARRHFERELEVNPTNAEAHFNIGLFEKIAGRPADGVPHWETALSHNPFFVPAYEELVEYYRGGGDDTNANAYQERLEALLDPD
jgi:tetratricopeptide (TPR) repeat protein